MEDAPNDIATLKAKIEGQEVTIKGLVEENKQLKAENVELRRRLGLDFWI